MINGVYDVTLLTPMGPQRGTVTLIEQNGSLSGSIRAMGNESTFRNGTVNGNAFEFSGVLRTGFFNFPYTARGTVEGNTLHALATTNAGTFQISGRLLSR